MNLGRIYSDYKDEIELAWIQNSAVECELYSIIASVIRESESGRIISLRDVSARRTTENSKELKSDAGFPDFVVLKRTKEKKALKFGCIEIKRPAVELDMTEQIEKHIDKFGKVIYTNGLLWEFYDHEKNSVWKCKLGEICNGSIKWQPINEWFSLLEKIDNISWEN